MSLRSSLILITSLSMLAVLVGCGGSGSSGGNNTITGTTSTNSELNGTYAFSVSGTDTNQEFFAMTGALTADGTGKISGGAADYNDPGSGFQGADLAITGGSYAVGSDGRGTATLAVSKLGSVSVDFVLTSTSHGLITRFDKNGTGSGTLDLQSTVSQSQLVSSYAFSLSGEDANLSPVTMAGAFTLDGSGNITTGLHDVNDSLNTAVGQALSGTVTVGSGTTPGTATLNTSLGVLTFDVYAVDQTHLKFVEADTVAVMAGDVFTQTGATLPSGAAVFTIGGLSGSGLPLAAGGLLTFNSDGTISGGSEAVNNDGSFLSVSFTGTYTALAGGRSVLNLSGFTPATEFSIYPSSGGLIMEEIDTDVALTSGTGFAQTATTFSTTGGYGFNLSASNLSAGIEIDYIAAFTATGSTITGTLDENDEGSTQPGQALSGTYGATGGGLGTLTFGGGNFNADYFIASTSNVLLIEADAGQVGVGSFVGQSAVGDSAAVTLHAAVARPKSGFRPALGKRKIEINNN
jgi:hypothetical protein